MLVLLILFFILLIILFFLARSLANNFYLFFYFLTHNQEKAVQFLTWFFLPGTIVHELSHLLVAELLFVPTGKLIFKPEIQEDKKVRLGGIKIAETGPLRHSLIGLAPIIIGVTSITSIIHFILLPLSQKLSSRSFSPLNYRFFIIHLGLLFVICYLLFCLSNTMFSSKKDLQTILFPILLVLLLATVFWLGNFKVSLPLKTINILTNLLKNLNYALAATVIIDLIFLFFIKLMLKKPPSNLVL